MVIEQGDKVFLGERKTPFRAVTMGHLRGERAVALCDSSQFTVLNDWIQNHERMETYSLVTEVVQVSRWIPVADLVRDSLRHGWRERWQQQSLPL